MQEVVSNINLASDDGTKVSAAGMAFGTARLVLAFGAALVVSGCAFTEELGYEAPRNTAGRVRLLPLGRIRAATTAC